MGGETQISCLNHLGLIADAIREYKSRVGVCIGRRSLGGGDVSLLRKVT